MKTRARACSINRSGDDRARLTALYEIAIRDQIVPAYRRVRDFIRNEYLPKCRTTGGLGGLPGGNEMYLYQVRAITTTRLTPQEIREIGLREVARVKKEIEMLHKASGHKGDLKAWAAELKANTVHYTSADDAIDAYRALQKRVEPLLPQMFGRLPKTGYEIRAVEPHREMSAPSQYWRAGGGRPAVFYANLSGLRVAPIVTSMSLFLHETLPGHHLQIRLQQENTGVPNFRRGSSYTAFTEGWAHYAESLGWEFGLYDDPYQRLAWMNGTLSMAVHLVVDTNVHTNGWTKEQAINFLRENTLNSVLYNDAERGFERSAERYMAWPGQTLAYKIGEMKFRELRAQAERELGPKFDLRAFHDEVLKDGDMPFEMLEAKMNRWIASQHN